LNFFFLLQKIYIPNSSKGGKKGLLGVRIKTWGIKIKILAIYSQHLLERLIKLPIRKYKNVDKCLTLHVKIHFCLQENVKTNYYKKI
jgi:hypothetical protein